MHMEFIQIAEIDKPPIKIRRFLPEREPYVEHGELHVKLREPVHGVKLFRMVNGILTSPFSPEPICMKYEFGKEMKCETVDNVAMDQVYGKDVPDLVRPHGTRFHLRKTLRSGTWGIHIFDTVQTLVDYAQNFSWTKLVDLGGGKMWFSDPELCCVKVEVPAGEYVVLDDCLYEGCVLASYSIRLGHLIPEISLPADVLKKDEDTCLFLPLVHYCEKKHREWKERELMQREEVVTVTGKDKDGESNAEGDA